MGNITIEGSIEESPEDQSLPEIKRVLVRKLPTGVGKRGPSRITPNKAFAKLAQLGFDPLEEMVKLHDEIETQLLNMTHDLDGNPKKYSLMAHAQLTASKQKCVEALLRYGYARATETIEVAPKAIIPMSVTLTGTAVDFDTSRLNVYNEENIGNRLVGSIVNEIVEDDDDEPMKGKDE